MKRVETSLESSSKKAGFISILYDSAGEEEVEFMKELAREGKGLVSFIRDIGERYASRER